MFYIIFGNNLVVTNFHIQKINNTNGNENYNNNNKKKITKKLNNA